ncbi:NAD(P)-dependent dehydrogenase, short-chain alcohol dehydrogenase family [Chryseobacterium wanjuense]|jgi:NAD(P)-dependent dehydrogenase (short-subunit alcohol dehydrogenase family)|uniref:NAD(P)-dependent dehydrogenase, short-chain alcohol dehydrogenase family n=1 Tax=Chryseobacterium wanjuense TaxID=356305 RepID=A0A1I0NLF6_9FLAO|nr:SDR family oxidoreductase [Chryseobacterium wanjuense]SEW02114.1 NAD(P)-dependent dehydrogenase, short-chain alcohol dehydrogenase family [Chryseobacterium wanjuense]
MKTKIALITGASRGIGRNAALKIAEKGLDIIITYNNRKEEAETVVKQIKMKGRHAVAYQLNTKDFKSFDQFVKDVTSYLQQHRGSPAIDYLINNAGTALNSLISQTTEDQIDDIIDIHFKGMFLLTQKMLPYLNDGGGIVNISSGLARIALPSSSVYGSIKAAVEMMTRYMAKELGNRKIKANVVAPGAVETDFGDGRIRDDKELNKIIASRIALGRVGIPDDIGGVIAFLCTEEARWINGQRIEVAGGMCL